VSVGYTLDRSDEVVQAAAGRLRDASAARTPCAPVRDILPTGDVDTAYAVQRTNTLDALGHGRRLSGRKIGLTSDAVQLQLGVDQPDFGALFSDMGYTSEEIIPFHSLIQPRAEAEVAFVLGSDLPARPVTVDDLVRAIDFALPALEIVDSRIENWDISIVDTIADNASSGVYVLGTQPVPLANIDLPTIQMTLTKDGRAASNGMGKDCLGDPLNAVLWLANTVVQLGAPLSAGEIVLSGALGPMVSVSPGAILDARISQLGTVRASFTSEEQV
jgi:2-keto-4-pentenoate hydratase